ncbi:ABC transporter substrate-binding protein [Lichenifustis flavocetrariae]|uniref:ABC transporter substrate-binding protein n=1 Tax=Lichenifustis flavocetrariae TaxID=2949735 RepID=A0AA41Z4B3_9HYPH|nr:ABC transporter substrate-binding protein [Lichenifustis flavocetrariae]MCW6508997.1 ABC transporter substrate-binding protein [Lichenifustis flavocetrariae]
MRIAQCALALSAVLSLSGVAAAAGLDDIDPAVKDRLYNSKMLDPAQPIGQSAYVNWKPKKGPPWTIGYASSYAGNTWRAAVMQELQNTILPKWQKLGLIKDVVITQSNLNDSTQIQQMRQLVDQGVDAIVVCCSNPTALNQTVKYAYDHGVPTFSLTGYLTSPYSVNASVNYQLAGYQIGKWMADEVGGKGNILVVEGIPGTSGSDSQDRGVKAGLASAPGIQVVGDVAGMWTDQVAQGEVQKWLATNPGQLDGIVVQSAAELGVLRALQQSGRDMVPVALGGELGALCYWRQNPKFISAAYQVWPPADEFALIWNVMMRTLEGQGPKLQSIMVDPIKINYADVEKALPADCNPDADSWLSVGNAKWGGDPAFLDQFFTKPANPEAFKP